MEKPPETLPLVPRSREALLLALVLQRLPVAHLRQPGICRLRPLVVLSNDGRRATPAAPLGPLGRIRSERDGARPIPKVCVFGDVASSTHATRQLSSPLLAVPPAS